MRNRNLSKHLQILAIAALTAAPLVSVPNVNADPTITADPVRCDTGERVPDGGQVIGGSAGPPQKARVDHKDAIFSDVYAQCSGQYNIFFRYRITRLRDGRSWSGYQWLTIRGSCSVTNPCERTTQTARQKIGDSFTGNDVFEISILKPDGSTGGGGEVYPATFLPPVLPPTGTPLETFVPKLIPATL